MVVYRTRFLLLALCASAAGCLGGGQGSGTASAWDRLNLFKPPVAPPPPVEGFVLRPEGLVAVKQPTPGTPQALLAGARELYRKEKYEEAERLFKHIADNKHNPAVVAQEALYYEAECLRLQNYYPKAADVYYDLVNRFPHTPYRDQALQHMFDIANYWLNDTREEMREAKEKRDGQRWFVTPRFISFDRTKPFLDREGRAVQTLERVRYGDIKGPLSDTALFMAGNVKLYNEDYRDADNLFSQIVNDSPRSPWAAKALELAIYSKHMSTGGSDYDGRKVAEARQLVHQARGYAEMNKRQDWLQGQLASINLQQADKDFKIARFYERTGHPGSAYFYYEIVRRRYPGIPLAEQAAKKAEELKAKLDKPPEGGITSVLPSFLQPYRQPELVSPPRQGPAPGTEQAPPPRKLPNPPQPLPAGVVQ